MFSISHGVEEVYPSNVNNPQADPRLNDYMLNPNHRLSHLRFHLRIEVPYAVILI
jgi:hypothetical protein